MLTGDNGILTRAGEAKEKATIAGETEQIQLEELGSYEKDGTLLVGTVNSNIKSHISEITTDDSTDFPLTATYTSTGRSYKIDENGNVTFSVPGPIVRHTISPEDGTNNTEITIVLIITPTQGTTIKSITKPEDVIETGKNTYKVTENGIYTFVIEGSDGGKTEYQVAITNSKEPNYIGDYVEYDVSYADLYSDIDTTSSGLQPYLFTSIDGWRILDQGTINSDATRSNVKIISTGIPGILYYHYKEKIGNENDTPAGLNKRIIWFRTNRFR